MPVEKIIEEAARIGFEGDAVLQRGMAEDAVPYLSRLKRCAFRNGMALPMQPGVKSTAPTPNAASISPARCPFPACG